MVLLLYYTNIQYGYFEWLVFVLLSTNGKLMCTKVSSPLLP